MERREPYREIQAKMGKYLCCSWQLLIGGLLALVCLSCQPSMPKAPRPAPPPPPAAAPEPAPQRETFYVKVGRLNLRAGPGMDFPKLGLLERNEEVEQVGEAQNWFQVRVKKDGSLGWVASEYLSKTPVPSPIEPPPAIAPGPQPTPAVKETPPSESAKPKPSKVETTVPRAPKPAEAAEPPAPKAKPAAERAPAPSPEPKATPEKPAPKKEEPSVPPTPAPPEERPSGSGIRIM